MNALQELLTTHDAARALRMSHAKILHLVRTESIPHIVLPGGDVRFDAEDLTGWAATLKRRPIVEAVP